MFEAVGGRDIKLHQHVRASTSLVPAFESRIVPGPRVLIPDLACRHPV